MEEKLDGDGNKVCREGWDLVWFLFQCRPPLPSQAATWTFGRL